MVIWYEILFAINMTTKKLQSKSMCIDITTKELESVMLFFEKYRNKGFEFSMNVAKSLAFDMNIELIGFEKWARRPTRQTQRRGTPIKTLRPLTPAQNEGPAHSAQRPVMDN